MADQEEMTTQDQMTGPPSTILMPGEELWPSSYPSLTLPHPHYHRVDKSSPEAHLEYRKRMYDMAMSSDRKAHAFREMCRQDFLFYVNTFVWTYRPGNIATDTKIPFCTWPVQDHIFDLMWQAIMEQHDLNGRKPREVGISWMGVTLLDWLGAYRDNVAIGTISAKERLVDNPGDMDALFPKIDKIHEWLPDPLRPPLTKRRKLFIGYETGSVNVGSATVADALRGGRKTVIWIDEAAHLADGRPGLDYRLFEATLAVSACRIAVSSPKGRATAHHDHEQKCKHRFIINWWECPPYREGLTLDEKGRRTSPWYRDRASRCLTDQEKASELDNDYEGSDENYFHTGIIKKLAEEAPAPLHVGWVDHGDGEFMGFEERATGPLSLWVPLDANGNPPRGEYFGGMDVAAGIRVEEGPGWSNSVLAIYDRKTWTKAAEYATSTMTPEIFGSLCVAICRWFSVPESEDVMLVWESNGQTGGAITRVVTRLFGYQNFWLRDREDSLGRQQTGMPGWFNRPDTKATAFGVYRDCLEHGRIKNLSKAAIEECLEYRYDISKGIVHRYAAVARNATEAVKSHGDRVIADVLACLLLDRYASEDETQPVSKPLEIPQTSISKMILESIELQKRSGEPIMKQRWY